VSEFIQYVPLFYNGKNNIVSGELYKGFPAHFFEQWSTHWKPSLNSYILQGKKRPEHAHWNWTKKAMTALISGEEDSFFWIDYNSDTQGIMFTEQGISYFGGDAGKENIYIAFLETAPWNYYKDESEGYYEGVGIMLLTAAIRYSGSLGFEGRIALESLPQSKGFYKKNKMIPVEKHNYNSQLTYFELTTENAQEFLKEDITNETYEL
jgi:hypothetical protein